MLACDSELQDILKKLPELDLGDVKSLRVHYENETTEAMTEKIRSIKSLHNLTSPMKPVDGGWIPDYNSRYFTADFPYGLAIIEAFANVLECKIPNIKATMNWYRSITRTNISFDLEKYRIKTIKDIYEFYQTNLSSFYIQQPKGKQCKQSF